MHKTIAVTLGFCGPKVLNAGLESYAKTAVLPSPHYLVYQHYPVGGEQNKIDLHNIADKRGMQFFDSGYDRGLIDGFNNLMNTIGWDSSEYIVGVDPDSDPDTVGWDKAAVEVLHDDPQLGWVTLSSKPIKYNIDEGVLGGQFRIIGGHKVFVPYRVDMINVTVWRSSFLKEVGGLKQSFKYYGQVEAPMWNDLLAKQMKYGYLYDYTELGSHGAMHDDSYTKWKRDHIGGYSGGFAQWLMNQGS